MVTEFSQIISTWHSFYATIAGASATLLGLLFVTASINREHLDLHENARMMSLAKQTFIRYLFILVFSLTMLIPRNTPASLCIPITSLGLFGLLNIVKEMIPHVKKTKIIVLIKDYGWSLLAFILMISSSIHVIIYADTSSLFHMVSALVMMFVSATKSSWQLFIELKKN
jgi:hypothetical protein